VTVDQLVPPDYSPLREVVYHGKNSLPAFTLFQKRFCRPTPETGSDTLWGYNHTNIAWLVGPGYFLYHPIDGGAPAIDYRFVPPAHPNNWPDVRPNDRGASVYRNMVDYLRRVSQHVLIGSATRGGKELGNYRSVASPRSLFMSTAEGTDCQKTRTEWSELAVLLVVSVKDVPCEKCRRVLQIRVFEPPALSERRPGGRRRRPVLNEEARIGRRLDENGRSGVSRSSSSTAVVGTARCRSLPPGVRVVAAPRGRGQQANAGAAATTADAAVPPRGRGNTTRRRVRWNVHSPRLTWSPARFASATWQMRTNWSARCSAWPIFART
jgi:hypothetical protein